MKVILTSSHIDALMTAANAMLAGEEGEGDFLCSATILDQAVDSLARAQVEQIANKNTPTARIKAQADLAAVTAERDDLAARLEQALEEKHAAQVEAFQANSILELCQESHNVASAERDRLRAALERLNNDWTDALASYEAAKAHTRTWKALAKQYRRIFFSRDHLRPGHLSRLRELYCGRQAVKKEDRPSW